MKNIDSVINISKLPSGEKIVGSSTLLPSDFTAATSHILKFVKALNEIPGNASGAIEIKPDATKVEALVDGVSVIKFCLFKETGWIVGNSCALPADIFKAKGYVSAMEMAYGFVLEKMKSQKEIEVLNKRKVVVNEYSISGEYGLIRVVEGSVDDKAVFTAKEIDKKWEFNVSGCVTDDLEWIQAFTEVSSRVVKRVKALSQ